MRRNLSQVLCLSLLGVLPGTVLAQNIIQRQPAAQPVLTQPGTAPAAPDRQRTTANKPVVGDQANFRDQQIASLLLICNQKEIRLGELAKAHAKHKDVKEFAEKMVQDHGQMVSSLQKLGAQGQAAGTPNAASGVNLQTDNNNTNDPNNTQVGVSGNLPSADQPGRLNVQVNRDPNSRRENRAERRADQAGDVATSAVGGGAPGQSLDYVAISREIADKCVAEAEREWNSKKAEECDMAYIGAQIVAHKDMITTGKVLRQYAGPELQSAIDKGVQTAEQHLEHAMKIIDTLAQDEKSKSKSSS